MFFKKKEEPKDNKEVVDLQRKLDITDECLSRADVTIETLRSTKKNLLAMSRSADDELKQVNQELGKAKTRLANYEFITNEQIHDIVLAYLKNPSAGSLPEEHQAMVEDMVQDHIESLHSLAELNNDYYKDLKSTYEDLRNSAEEAVALLRFANPTEKRDRVIKDLDEKLKKDIL